MAGVPIGPGRLPTGEPYDPNPAMPGFTEPPTPAEEAGLPEGVNIPEGLNPRTSAFVKSTYDILDDSYRSRARQYFLDAGVSDLANMQVQAVLDAVGNSTNFYEDNPGAFEAQMSAAVQGLMQTGVLTQTPYSQALLESGFGFQEPAFNEAPQYDYLTYGRAQNLLAFEGEGVDWVKNDQTGWVQWKNGTLVNPTAQIGDPNAVIFEPNSMAPGSRGWMTETIPSWSEGKINEWRGKLIEGGYLPGDQKKGAVDATFLNAMQQYQTVRYQNNGTPMPIGPTMGGATGSTPFNFKQLQGQVRNDIRVQWQSVYGVTPDDNEIEPLEEMVIKTAHSLYKKGQMSSSQAAQEAEERMIERMQNSPEAQFVTSNVQENTQLHDSILRAVQVTSAMG